MKESIIQYLALKTGYRHTDENTLLRRPDDLIVARLQGDRWRANPTQQEIINFSIYSGRGLPSLLCEYDLTNHGSR